ILTNAKRWPLIIDPQEQGIKWIKQREGEELRVVRLGQKGYLDTIERAVSGGECVLIENLSEDVDPVLDNLLGFADFNNLNLDAPLNEGKYSFLVQQTGPASSYTLDFGVATAIPEPSAFVLVGMLTLSFAGASRRRR
ncbi:MAG: PEP-CTERM sorting domain-containing protein, partial [Planctomycetota bacterium]